MAASEPASQIQLRADVLQDEVARIGYGVEGMKHGLDSVGSPDAILIVECYILPNVRWNDEIVNA
jgi:hypothetical protein